VPTVPFAGTLAVHCPVAVGPGQIAKVALSVVSPPHEARNW